MVKLKEAPSQKLTITNLDEGTTFEAQYNPKEISVDRSVPWNKHQSSKGDTSVLEFTNAEPIEVSFELLFDLHEEKGNVYEEYLGNLLTLTEVRTGGRGEGRRPPLVLLTWGDAFPRLKAVIESVNVTYTLFLADGTPSRATATVRLKQADKAKTKVRKKKRKEGGARTISGRG